jgi:hypothetical protein
MWRVVAAAETAREIRAWILGVRWDFCLGTEVRRRVARNMAGECWRRRFHDESQAEGPRRESNWDFRCCWWGVRDML